MGGSHPRHDAGMCRGGDGRRRAVRGLLDSLATLGGPVVAAVLLAASGPAAVFAACSAASLLAGLVVVALPYDAPPRVETARAGSREMLQGFRTIAADRKLALITGLGVVQTFTRGCLTVFAVVIAIDLLDTGDAGVGVLNAAVRAGGGDHPARRGRRGQRAHRRRRLHPAGSARRRDRPGPHVRGLRGDPHAR